MKLFKSLVITLIALATLVFAQPSLADAPDFFENPDYIEVTKTLDSLKTVQEAQVKPENYNADEIQNKINELEFQKYALETGIDWGQCRNETGKMLAVYGPKPDIDDDDFNYQYDNGLYFLADGQTTKKKWDCQGVYLPSGVNLTGLNSDEQGQDLGGPIAVKIMNGTQLVVSTNSNTGAVELNVSPSTSKVFKSGEISWFIPDVPQSAIDTRVANAPVAKMSEVNQLLVMKNLEKNIVEAKAAPKAESQPQPKSEEQSKPQSPLTQNSVKTSYPIKR